LQTAGTGAQAMNILGQGLRRKLDQILFKLLENLAAAFRCNGHKRNRIGSRKYRVRGEKAIPEALDILTSY
jgi:hypothetical protein